MTFPMGPNEWAEIDSKIFILEAAHGFTMRLFYTLGSGMPWLVGSFICFEVKLLSQ